MNPILEEKIIKWEAHRSRADASLSPELALELRRDFIEVFEAGRVDYFHGVADAVAKQIDLTEKARDL